MKKLLKIILLFCIPLSLFADVVWPALYLETRMFSWWAITFGMIIEIIFIKYIFDFDFKKIIKIVFIANILSALIGIVAIPLSGILIELIPGGILYYTLNLGTFNPITWGITFIVASFVTTYIEYIIYKKLFLIEIQIKDTKFFKLFLVNILSVGIAFISLWIYPVHL